MEKTILKTDYFDVIEKEGWQGIKPIKTNVVIFPFQVGSSKLPERVLVMDEINPLREGGRSITLVSGDVEDEDPDILNAAIRELKEETGYDVSDIDRWTFMGQLTTSKLVDADHPVFAVDISGLTPGEAETDGSENELNSELKIITIEEALKSSDAFIPALFMRVFKYVFGVDVNNQETNTVEK